MVSKGKNERALENMGLCLSACVAPWLGGQISSEGWETAGNFISGVPMFGAFFSAYSDVTSDFLKKQKEDFWNYFTRKVADTWNAGITLGCTAAGFYAGITYVTPFLENLGK